MGLLICQVKRAKQGDIKEERNNLGKEEGRVQILQRKGKVQKRILTLTKRSRRREKPCRQGKYSRRSEVRLITLRMS